MGLYKFCLVFAGLSCISAGYLDPLKSNKTYIVTSIQSEPYLMYHPETLEFVGFIPDLLRVLADIVNFNYEIRLVKDGKFGNKNMEDRTWNGMVGELTRGEADIAFAPLVIASMRSRVVDFTHPFMFYTLAMLTRRSDADKVWSFSDIVSNNMKVYVVDSSRWQFNFRVTRIAVEEKIYGKMMKQEDSFVKTFEEGVEKVRNSSEPAVLFTDYYSALPYRCDPDLHVRQSSQYVVTFGVATPFGSELKHRLDLAVLEMVEVGVTRELEQKWWYGRENCPL